jgi:pimeloyl-ACP methyl ester carboxylesterase
MSKPESSSRPHPQAGSKAPRHREAVAVNGTTIYYEVVGSGAPLILLHGYTQSSASWIPFVEYYAPHFQVYLVDLRGHGKSGWFTETLNIKTVAEDIEALLDYLNLNQVNAIGFSFGGDVLFQLALLNHRRLRSMIIIGSCGSCNLAEFPQWVEYLSYNNIDKLPWMREQHTSEEQIKLILDQTQNYNALVTSEQLKSINIPVMLVYGDQEDSVSWSDIFQAKETLLRSSLWVLPNTPHRAHVGVNMNEFINKSLSFFESF